MATPVVLYQNHGQWYGPTIRLAHVGEEWLLTRYKNAREFDSLLALCKAGPYISNADHAIKFVAQLVEYLPFIHSLQFRSSPLLRSIKPSPWEELAKHLTGSLLALGCRFSSLRKKIHEGVLECLNNCFQDIENQFSLNPDGTYGIEVNDMQHVSKIVAIAVSLVGFLEAASTHANFWSTSERVDIIRLLRHALSEKFLIAVERATSIIQNTNHSNRALSDWQRYAKRYMSDRRPLGAMLIEQSFMKFVLACNSKEWFDDFCVSPVPLLNKYISGISMPDPSGEEKELVKCSVGIIKNQISILEDGSDYLQIGSAEQQTLVFSIKSLSLASFLNCIILDEKSADPALLLVWLERTLVHPDQMGSTELATVSLMTMTVLARLSPQNASSISRSLLKFITQNGGVVSTVATAAGCLAETLRLLPQDTVIGTIYSLGNVISAGSTTTRYAQTPASRTAEALFQNSAQNLQMVDKNSVSSDKNDSDDMSVVYKNVINAIVTIATSSNDSKIVALAQSMLLQKIGKINKFVDACIIEETASLSVYGDKVDFEVLLKFYSRTYRNTTFEKNVLISNAVLKAKICLSKMIDTKSPLFGTYTTHLLESIVSKGDIGDRERDNYNGGELSAEEILPLLTPLAVLFSRDEDLTMAPADNEEIASLFRDLWFNIAAHGISTSSEIGQRHYQELRILAANSPPLVAENRSDMLESDIELNTILVRGSHQTHTTEKRRRSLISELPGSESEIKHLSYPKLTFLSAALFLESLRASCGNCAKVVMYFSDPTMNNPAMASCMEAVSNKVMSNYLETCLKGNSALFSSPRISLELADLFVSCCHRIEKVQQAAIANADRIIEKCPSALCDKRSLFALLDLLSVLWASCLDEDLDEFEWRSSITSVREGIRVELPDDYDFRRNTLNNLEKRARAWMTIVMNISPLDIKGLLQTYLSDHDDIGAYGDICMGRSFALEMGSAVPPGDPKLSSIDTRKVWGIDIASDFIGQYTTRQEYRFSSDTPFAHHRALDVSTSKAYENVIQETKSSLAELENIISQGHHVSLLTVRDRLRKAASLLCQFSTTPATVVSYLVNIPFQIFTEDSINMGVSLWLGVIHENRKAEPRIVSEVAEAWEGTMERKLGIFDPNFTYIDSFMMPTEFAPSDKSWVLKRQRMAQKAIAPHFHVLRFFESHFNATRLSSNQIQKIFRRLIDSTLQRLMRTECHPLTREIHFRVVLLGLKILHYSTNESKVSIWKLNDLILSSALTWFRYPPRWSFGGNRLQVKSEDKILGAIEDILQTTSRYTISVSGSHKSLQGKQCLLQILIENERSRLAVWLFPLSQEKKGLTFSSSSASKSSFEHVSALVPLAWAVHPSLALQLPMRFYSSKIRNDVRSLLLRFPEKALDNPDSLDILIGSALPNDVSFQLKYLLYWAPLNPISSIVYFLPVYKDHPFILQYAMRALDSHAIDVSFFYIPQMVQALRYDHLGYVERFLFQTAQLSQLFAHQVIWNMKANSFKDEDAQIPDPLKPVLDRFLSALIESLSNEDRDFYEREFTFFNEVTGISGKLRPFIKKSKPEKKQKIEDELRKITVDVGVYLPSNPDGVVIGIDRKSSKPLQSHAKAPFMATFRIRKTKKDDTVAIEGSNDPQNEEQGAEIGNTYDVWQSAIFKVGDDCRQDVLALQMIASFRSIFANIGLDVFLYPYRVTATAPGCGVIDVLPNSISRDMLGREAVNGLYDYFISKHGGEQSIRFQEARSNFVKSMAAYSVVSYLLQFKDRHNGNIMVDDAGHVLHVDFGFCFDIGPGGIKFERAPFKLTSEMIAVMGGTNPHPTALASNSSGLPGVGTHNPSTSQAYRWFEALVVKAFLASRPHATKLSHIVALMLDSGLPCFKPETLKNFMDRFVLDKSEREASDYMQELIRKSYMNRSTKEYDRFQLWTNNIPF